MRAPGCPRRRHGVLPAPRAKSGEMQAFGLVDDGLEYFHYHPWVQATAARRLISSQASAAGQEPQGNPLVTRKLVVNAPYMLAAASPTSPRASAASQD